MDDETADQPPPADQPREPGGLARSVGAGGAAAAGVFLWPSDAATGAAVGALLSEQAAKLVQGTMDELQATRRRNAGAAAALAAQHRRIPVEELLVRTRSSPHSERLLSEALEGAAATEDERKIAGFARAIANGLAADPARVDHERSVVRALAAIETPHVRVLLRLPADRGQRRGAMRLAAVVSGSRRRPDPGSQQYQEAERGTAPLLALLEAQGLARTNAAEIADRQLEWAVAQAKYELTREMLEATGKRGGMRAPETPGDEELRWCRTSFGGTCVGYLQERAGFGQATDVGIGGTVVVRPDVD